MAVELYPSSYRCDCGQELDFFENPIRDMKRMSKYKRVRLGGEDHTIINMDTIKKYNEIKFKISYSNGESLVIIAPTVLVL